jgi:hypothetical protein
VAQHQRITLQRVENLLARLEYHEPIVKEAISDLLRTLVLVDSQLVKHEHTDTARQLRKGFDRAEDNL